MFGGGGAEYEIADFPLGELALKPETLAALEAAGYTTFLDILDLDRRDLLTVEGIDEAAADAVLALIDELTVEDAPGAAAPAQPTPSEDELEEVAELLGLDASASEGAAPEAEAAGAEPDAGVGGAETYEDEEAAESPAEPAEESAEEPRDEDAGAQVMTSGAGESEERGAGDDA